MTELDARSRAGANTYVDASRLTAGLLGDAVTANVFLLGVAYQAGVLPVTAASIESAIDLNGTAVDLNLQAFRWGRLWVVDPERVERQAGLRTGPSGSTEGLEDFAGDPELQRMLAVRVAELTAYQDRRYAQRYLELVRRCAAAERDAGTDGTFTRTVAHQLHRLMAYKDEYEVARLLLDGGDQVARTFGDVEKVTWNLHPPMLRAMGMKRKLKLGPWARPALVSLRSMKRLRGTRLDPFGRAEVRRTERQLIVDYAALVDELRPPPGDRSGRGRAGGQPRRRRPRLRGRQDGQHRRPTGRPSPPPPPLTTRLGREPRHMVSSTATQAMVASAQLRRPTRARAAPGRGR